MLFGMGRDQEFLKAAHSGNIAFIEKALHLRAKRNGPITSLRCIDINVQDSLGYSALHHASLNGHYEMVSVLLANEASPNLPDSRGLSPLHLAAWAGHAKIVSMLLDHQNRSINPNLLTVEKETPLHCAVHQGHVGVISVLLEHNADPSLRNCRYETPLELAAQYGHLEVVRMLVSSHPELILKPTYDNTKLPKHTCLHLASRNGHSNVVNLLLAAGININLLTYNGSALHEAALCGKETVVRILLEAGIDLNATNSEGRTALDMLKKFPPHVTESIISLINSFSNNIENGTQQKKKPDALLPKLRIFAKNENQQPVRGSCLPNNHHYHFNSNNHLLNLSLGDLVEKCFLANKCNSNDCMSTDNSSERTIDFGNTHSPLSADEHNWSNRRECFAGNRENTSLLQKNDKSFPAYSFTSYDSTLNEQCGNSFVGGLNSISMKKTKESSSVPPKKPPRRNTSDSSANKELNHQRSFSIGSYSEPKCSDNRETDFNSVAFIKNNKFYNTSHRHTDDFIKLAFERCKQPLLQHIKSIDGSSNVPCEVFKPVLKSYDLNRKLKRNRNSSSLSDKFCQSISSSNSCGARIIEPDLPQSPTNYVQPPTPDHPPPSVKQAERMIHERIRPLCMQYKKKQNLRNSKRHTHNNMSKAVSRPVSLPRALPVDTTLFYPRKDNISFIGSTGSLNSGINYNYISFSTESLDENVNPIPLLARSDFDIKYLSQEQDVQVEKCSIEIMNQYKQRKNNQLVEQSESDSQSLEKMYGVNNINGNPERWKETVSLPKALPLQTEDHNLDSLTLTNREELRDRISQIIESFGSDIVIDDLFKKSSDSNLSLFDFDEGKLTTEQQEMVTRLEKAGLIQWKRTLFDNGYDNYRFVNGIFNELDLQVMNISIIDAPKLIEFVKALPMATFKLNKGLNKHQPSDISSQMKQKGPAISDWLESIDLPIYIQCFSQHLYNNIESVVGVWDVELQTVLEINKVGHRRRILQSISYYQETQN